MSGTNEHFAGFDNGNVHAYLDDCVNTHTNTTHLLWVGRWVEVVRVPHPGEDGWAWRFKSGKDAGDWLRYK